jgi:hypothetical protein
MKLTTHLFLVLRSRMCGTIPPPPIHLNDVVLSYAQGLYLYLRAVFYNHVQQVISVVVGFLNFNIWWDYLSVKSYE